jgi:hypothetical protein
MAYVSLFQYYKNRGRISLDEAANRIYNGFYKQQIVTAQSIHRSGDTAAYTKFKQGIPAFVTTGIVKGSHKDANLTTYSKYLILDLDKIPLDQLEIAFLIAIKILSTYMCFRSPSGSGLKIIVLVDSDKEFHNQAFHQVADFYEEKLGIPVDRSGVNIARLCFFSYDPLIYHNIHCIPFHVQVNKPVIQNNSELSIKTEEIIGSMEESIQRALKKTTKIIEFKEGERNKFIFTLAVNCTEENIPLDVVLKYILQNYGFNAVEVEKTVKSAYSKFGLNQGKKKQQYSLFSLNFLNFMNYKPEIECDKRIFFEALLNKHLFYRRDFHFSGAEIENELGIKRGKKDKLLKELEELGLFKKTIKRTIKEGKPLNYTFYEILPKGVYKVARLLMKNSSEFEKRIRPLLERKKATYSYNGWN